MVACEGCGFPLRESVESCPRCARPLDVAVAPGHLSRVAIAGNPGASQYGTLVATRRVSADFIPPSRFSSTPLGGSDDRQARLAAEHPDDTDEFDAADQADHDSEADPDASRSFVTSSSPEWDPDATTRFMPAYSSRNDVKNTAALVALAVFLVAAVSSLAWLIGESVISARPLGRPSAGASPSATPISTAVPKNATVCTPEVARSTNTSCTLARRVLSGVRTLGTDLPDTFRVTVVDPQSAKNATFVCSIKSWIQCVSSGDVTVYVMRQV